ncbi:MAG: CocE/NonD family hydrolase [Dehalococcoidia bacterium]|nr:CocE/NonD family hydrolase [Dehalococcoidia bacterium]
MTEASRPDYGVMLARDVEMRTRDGARLATDVWRPALDGAPLPGPFPAVMVRTPYDRRLDRYQREGEFWASHGYVLVLQDVRGRFGSEGEFRLLANEGPDGYDAVEWAAAQPFCDSNVGTFGTSYSGWVQGALALERPPHLRAMWINQGGSNGNSTALRHNGALELRWLTWAVSHGAVSPEAARDPILQRRLHQNSIDMYEWLRRLPWTEGNTPLEGLPVYEQWARDLYEHADDGEFWRQRGLNFEPYDDETADVPTMYSGGWYDSYTKATTDRYVSLKGRLGQQRLLMGPWTHGDAALDHSWAGEVELGSDAPIGQSRGGARTDNRRHVLLRWFDHWLRGVDNGVGEESAARIFVMGGGSGERTAEGRLLHGGAWRDAPDWPLAEAQPRPFYLLSDGALGASAAPDAQVGASTFRFDPADPLPTISANTSSLNEVVPTPPRVTVATPITLMRVMVVQGGADQRTRPDVHSGGGPFGPLEDRPDVLAFTSEPLAEDLEAIGPVEAVLYVDSDAPDTDFFVMLQDVYPPSDAWPEGYRLNITDGIMRARYREGMDCPRLLQPGEVTEVRFALYPTSNRFAAGHRIQVLVSSSSFPRFDVNPNTGEPVGRHTRTHVATNTVHHSAEHPSRVVLSVVPAA